MDIVQVPNDYNLSLLFASPAELLTSQLFHRAFPLRASLPRRHSNRRVHVKDAVLVRLLEQFFDLTEGNAYPPFSAVHFSARERLQHVHDWRIREERMAEIERDADVYRTALTRVLQSYQDSAPYATLSKALLFDANFALVASGKLLAVIKNVNEEWLKYWSNARNMYQHTHDPVDSFGPGQLPAPDRTGSDGDGREWKLLSRGSLCQTISSFWSSNVRR